METRGSRRAEARLTARQLVEALEDNAPIDRCLMKAQRLARMLRDSDAQLWLDHEMRGYPADFVLAKLGTSQKYAWRWLGATKTVLTTSLPDMEAQVRAAEMVLSKMQAPNVTTTAANYIESGATTAVITAISNGITSARDRYSNAVAQFSRSRSHLYRYAADTLVSLEFGEVAEDIFQAARNAADEFLRSNAPKAIEQLLAAEERMADGDAESLSASLTSCRRVLSTVADAIFPPRSEPYVDHTGKSRKVGEAEYLNRLLAFMESRISSGSTRAILDTQLSYLAARLDAVYAKASKGVHDEVTIDEARLVVVQTYLYLAKVASVGGRSPPVEKTSEAPQAVVEERAESSAAVPSATDTPAKPSPTKPPLRSRKRKVEAA